MRPMHLYLFTVPGLERIAASEVEAQLQGSRLEEQRTGIVFFSYAGEPEPLLRLRTAEDLFALVARGTVSQGRQGLSQARRLVKGSPWWEAAVTLGRQLRPKKVHRATYRVVAQRRRGRHAYARRELQQWIGRAVGERFPNWKWVEEEALIEVWVLQEGAEVICGLRLSDRTMRHRTYKQASIRASLRPVVARAMAILSEPSSCDVFLDPMCGAGTILIERGEHGRYRQLLGGDLDPEAVAATRANVGPRYRPIGICRWDATELPLADRSATRLVCNLPFGRKVGSPEEIPGLYQGFLREAARVLAPGGIAVLLTSERQWLARSLAAHPELVVEQILPVVVLGQRAFIFKARHS